jgi:hypothetical protein
VTQELAEHLLVAAGGELSVDLQVRLYRARPSAKTSEPGPAQALWHFLKNRHGDPNTPIGTHGP